MSYRRVTFEAELDVEGLPEGFGYDPHETFELEQVRQVVQDAIGHTGAVVTDVFCVDAST